MTDPKQFICEFLGIPETDFAEVVINSKLMCDLLESYVAHVEKQRTFELKITVPDGAVYDVTNDTQQEYGNRFSQPPTDTNLPILFADTESKNIMVKKTDGSIVEIEPIDPSSETKYPNLLNATNRD